MNHGSFPTRVNRLSSTKKASRLTVGTTQPATYPMGNVGYFHRGKADGGVKLTILSRLRMSGVLP